MTATNQSLESDGLTVTENVDGTFTLEWDPCDSRWSVLNGMTSEEIGAIIMEQIKQYLQENGDQ